MRHAGDNMAFAQLFSRGLRVRGLNITALEPAWLLDVPANEWDRAGAAAREAGLRWAGLWTDQHASDRFAVCALLAAGGDYVCVRTVVIGKTPVLASHTPFFPAADRMERHARDLYGIEFIGHPDARRWTRHQAWPEDACPLRAGFADERRARTPPDRGYPFERVHGAGVYEIPVGPVHAGIIEPGHFRFQAVGEEILRLEQRLGYVHKGVEKIAAGRDPDGLARLAGRVSGDSAVAHAWAACQAMERAAGCRVTPRALHLRALMAERERVANHIGDIGAICNDVGFAFAQTQCARLRELWQRRSRELFGHRLMMDGVVPGGVRVDLPSGGADLLRADHRAFLKEIGGLFDVLTDHPSLDDRLLGTGCLGIEDAQCLGVTGYAGKASGQDFDVRRDHPYPPYDRLHVKIPVFTDGDVAARMRVRMEEIRNSLDLMDALLDALPDGAVSVDMPEPAAGEGIGIVEGWRGEIVTYVRFDDRGRVARFFPRDPSWFGWPALERLIHGNIVPDFPVCNKSINGSYSGHDL